MNNISSKITDPELMSHNSVATISDPLPQFTIIPNMIGNTASHKSNIFEKDWNKFHRENFILDYFSINWQDLLNIDELNVDNSIQMYLEKINILLDAYPHLKRIDKNKLRLNKSKLWITLGLQKSKSAKNKLLNKFINTKESILKEEIHIE